MRPEDHRELVERGHRVFRLDPLPVLEEMLKDAHQLQKTGKAPFRPRKPWYLKKYPT